MNYFLRKPEDDGGGGGGGTPDSLLAGGGGGGGEKLWYDSLPPELKTAPYVAGTKDLAAFVKSAIDTKSMVGANTIKLPGEKATPEERAAFFEKLGRPTDVNGYASTVKPAVDTLIDPDTLTQMRTVFHENGLTAAQGQAILDSYTTVANDGYTKAAESLAASREAGLTALKGEWGSAFEVNVKTAQLAIRELGGDDVLASIESVGLGNDPTFIKFLHTIGTKLLDDVSSGGGVNQFTGTAESAMAEITRLKTDKDFLKMWGDAREPGHKEAVDKWTSLHRQAYPGKQKDFQS